MIQINASTIGRNSIVNRQNKHSWSVFSAHALFFAAQLFEFSRFLARTGPSVKLTAPLPLIKLDFPDDNERRSSLKKGLFASFALSLSFFFYPSSVSFPLLSFLFLRFVPILLLKSHVSLSLSFSTYLLLLFLFPFILTNEIKLDRIPIIRIQPPPSKNIFSVPLIGGERG